MSSTARFADEESLPEKLSCQPKTTMLSAIRTTVTIGKREVGTLSLSGIRAARAYTWCVAEAPTADPWRDTDVIDSRAPRFNQSVVAIVAGLGAIFGWPLAWAIMGVQLLIGLTLGRRFCVTCLAYFELIQPRFGEGPLEDSRPPRLANAIGAAFLSAAALVWWLGSPVAGTIIGALVAALALLAATTGLCAGCELYRFGARLRGISPRQHSRIDPADLGGLNGHDRTFVEFTHPLCADCRQWEQRLRQRGALITVDVREQPQLARKYGIAVVPTVVAVAADGSVVERLAP
jgi:Domain of unknown function (DUF4395)